VCIWITVERSAFGGWGVVSLSFLFASLFTSAYFSLRVTQMQPINPRWPTSADLLKTSASSAALVVVAMVAEASQAAELELIPQWATPIAYGMIAGPALIPPNPLTVEDEPNRVLRWIRSQLTKKFDGLWKAAVLGGISFFVLGIFPPPSAYPRWFMAVCIAAVLSILTRPIALKDPEDGAVLQAHAFTPGLVGIRLMAILATVLWLFIAFPVLEATHNLARLGWKELAAVLLGWILTDLMAEGIEPAFGGQRR
jgi:hypothetical protein